MNVYLIILHFEISSAMNAVRFSNCRATVIRIIFCKSDLGLELSKIL